MMSKLPSNGDDGILVHVDRQLAFVHIEIGANFAQEAARYAIITLDCFGPDHQVIVPGMKQRIAGLPLLYW
jgi:hypothetical protein